MGATVAEIIEEHATDEDTAVYYSKHHNLRLLRQHHDVEAFASGVQRTTQKGVRYEFAPEGSLVVQRGQDMLPDGPGGQMQDAIDWLDAHPWANQRFWREGHEPDRARPTEQEFLRDANRALVARDVDALKALLQQEYATHNRKMLIDSAVSALTALRDAGEEVGDLSAQAEGSVPATGYAAELAAMDRTQLVQLVMEAGLEPPAGASDEQLRAALLLLFQPAEGGDAA